MRQWVHLAARLYPAAWRRRYGAEFEALLEASRPAWRDVFDVLRGAITMQMSTWSFRNVTAACGLAGLIIAAAWAFSLPGQYVSRAVMRIESPASGDPNAANDHLRQIVLQAMSRSSLSQIIQRPDLDLYKKERFRQPLEDVIEKMTKEDIRIDLLKSSPSATAFVVAFSYPDRYLAQKTTSALIARMTDANANWTAGVNNANLALLDPASLPQRPTTPVRWQIMLAGLALGLLAGSLAIGVRRWPMVAVAGLAGCILAAGASFLLPDTYISHALLRANASQQIPALTRQVLTDEFLKGVIEQEHLYPGSRADDAIETMRSRDIRLDKAPNALIVSFRYTDRLKAQHVVTDIVNALFLAANQSDSSASPHRPVEILDRASFPETPVAPNRNAFAAAGMGLGLVCAFIAQWRRRL